MCDRQMNGKSDINRWVPHLKVVLPTFTNDLPKNICYQGDIFLKYIFYQSNKTWQTKYFPCKKRTKTGLTGAQIGDLAMHLNN